MNSDILLYLILGTLGILAIVIVVFFILKNKMQTKNSRYRASLVEGTKTDAFSMEIFYQKFYIKCSKIPLLKRYLLKLRRRLEVLNLEDEYVTRKQL